MAWLSAGQLAVLFLPALINLWAIWHAGVRFFPSPLERLGWMTLGVLVPVLGGLIYLCFGMRRARRTPYAIDAESLTATSPDTAAPCAATREATPAAPRRASDRSPDAANHEGQDRKSH